MTTTNNHLTLIEQVGGIEKAKMIVGGAPEGATHFVKSTYLKLLGAVWWQAWLPEWSHNSNRMVSRWKGESIELMKTWGEVFKINDLRTAIEHHYYGRSEAEELAAYAELSQEKIEGGAMLVGDFSEARKIIDKQLESDHITDIRNHISPRTVVWDLASGEDWSVNHG